MDFFGEKNNNDNKNNRMTHKGWRGVKPQHNQNPPINSNVSTVLSLMLQLLSSFLDILHTTKRLLFIYET